MDHVRPWLPIYQLEYNSYVGSTTASLLAVGYYADYNGIVIHSAGQCAPGGAWMCKSRASLRVVGRYRRWRESKQKLMRGHQVGADRPHPPTYSLQAMTQHPGCGVNACTMAGSPTSSSSTLTISAADGRFSGFGCQHACENQNPDTIAESECPQNRVAIASCVGISESLV